MVCVDVDVDNDVDVDVDVDVEVDVVVVVVVVDVWCVFQHFQKSIKSFHHVPCVQFGCFWCASAVACCWWHTLAD